MTTKALQTELSFTFGEVNDNKVSADRTVIYIWGGVNDNKGTADRTVIYIWGGQ